MPDFTDIDAWESYAEARALVKPDKTDTASTKLATQALARANDYVDYEYYREFAQYYKDNPPPELAYATAIAAGIELTTPNYFSTTIAPIDQISVAKSGTTDLHQHYKKGEAGDITLSKPKNATIEAMLKQFFTDPLPESRQVLGIVISP